MNPDQSLLREWFLYNKETGSFIWRKESRPARPVLGKTAGTKRYGYIFIQAPGRFQIGAHRLAWIYEFGHIPDRREIDHKDGDRANNRISNLRVATSQQQKRNKSVQSNNRSGLKGAYFHSCRRGKKWRSQIRIAAKSVPNSLIFLGYFPTAEEAHAAYSAAAKKYFGEFAKVA